MNEGIEKKTVNNICINCNACLLSCPVDAIKFEINRSGFMQTIIDENKCINCNKCYNVCPINNEKEENLNVECFGAYSKDKKHVFESTSGGVFGEIAKYVLKNMGIVYGAAFDSDFMVNHIRINSIEDLKKIRGSKYVQSNLKNIYEMVSNDLKNDLHVLFSGVPCQVAGLKNYLKMDYEKLITVDVVCHGNPSSFIWKNYLSETEKENKSKVNHINFRSKKIEWKNPQFILKFDDSKEIQTTVYSNIYGQAFLRNMILNKACYDCKFNSFRNYSEITLGDFWGYETNGVEKEGLSLVMLNNKKGKEIFNIVSKKLIFFPANLKNACLGNYPIIHSSIRHYNYDKKVRENFTIKDLTNNLNEKSGLLKEKDSVAILNFHYENYNFGANLLAYSLSETLKKIGFKPYIIDFDPFDDLNPIKRFETFSLLRFKQNYLNMTPNFKKNEDLKILNEYFDSFIVGSDQVWRKEITGPNLKTYFFDFVEAEKNIVSYGASFGNSEFEGDKDEVIICKELLNKFYKISVRELDAINICKNNFNVKPEIVLDPTLLLSSKDYEKLFENRNYKKNTISAYFIFDYENNIQFSEKLKELFNGKEILNIKGRKENSPIGELFVYNEVNDWLGYIKNSDFVVTDSYHGVLFAIIFKKDFICLGKNSKALSRFNSLFDLLGGNLSSRNYSSLDEIESIDCLEKIDYEEIYKNIIKYSNKSILFLKKNIGKSKIKLTDNAKEQHIIKMENISMKSKIVDLEARLSNLNDSKEDLLIHIKNLNDNIILLQKDNSSLTDNIVFLKKDNSNLTDNIVLLQKDNNNLKENIVLLQKDNSKLNEELLKSLNSQSESIRNCNK